MNTEPIDGDMLILPMKMLLNISRLFCQRHSDVRDLFVKSVCWLLYFGFDLLTGLSVLLKCCNNRAHVPLSAIICTQVRDYPRQPILTMMTNHSCSFGNDESPIPLIGISDFERARVFLRILIYIHEDIYMHDFQYWCHGFTLEAWPKSTRSNHFGYKVRMLFTRAFTVTSSIKIIDRPAPHNIHAEQGKCKAIVRKR